jgi:hypothetical protein
MREDGRRAVDDLVKTQLERLRQVCSEPGRVDDVALRVIDEAFSAVLIRLRAMELALDALEKGLEAESPALERPELTLVPGESPSE